jgi:glycosyltransferase involved in cell wall biosynthesis
MSRIVYLLLTNAGVAGGQKVILRHVEALIELGFDAAVLTADDMKPPQWLKHDAPYIAVEDLRSSDVLVIPDDGVPALGFAVQRGLRTVVLCQSSAPYLAAGGLKTLIEQEARFSTLLSVAPGHSAMLRRLFPKAVVETVRCFADERLFRPGEKAFTGAMVPRKRPAEAAAVRLLSQRLHPATAELGWIRLENATEAQVAEVFAAASVHLSLSRMESVGLTTLEALASGCVCAGFTGGGGRQYATPDNGFWVDDDDCMAAADALAQAVSLVRGGGAPLRRYVEAALATAQEWSYAAFRVELEAAWSRLAPEARTTA